MKHFGPHVHKRSYINKVNGIRRKGNCNCPVKCLRRHLGLLVIVQPLSVSSGLINKGHHDESLCVWHCNSEQHVNKTAVLPPSGSCESLITRLDL